MVRYLVPEALGPEALEQALNLNREPMPPAIVAQQILRNFPIHPPYRFIDGIDAVSEAGIRGYHTFRKDQDFYRGHFPGRPVTPGAILQETMAQIGLLAYGMYLLRDHPELHQLQFLLVDTQLRFKGLVLPGQRVEVTAEKIYFRFHKLHCRARMTVSGQGRVCQGALSGMIITNTQ